MVDITRVALEHLQLVIQHVLDTGEFPDDEPQEEYIATGIVQIPSLNVRSGHGTNFEILDSLGPGTEVKVYEFYNRDGWDAWVRIGDDKWCASTWHGEIFVLVTGDK